MTITMFKINLDDKTSKRRKLLAKRRGVSLSALLRLIINEAYEQWGQQDGSRSCCVPYFSRSRSWI
jgi:hypothetical protein